MKILIWGEVKPGGPYDIFRQLDYRNIFGELKTNYQATGFNVGNKVWIQGIVSALSTKENELFFYNPDESWEVINEKYDKIVYSAANMLDYKYKELIDTLADIFKNSRIPVYVIAVGAQADSYDELDILSKGLQKEIRNFADSIYLTGGEIACRGYFTKELLDSICPNTAVVTGCPSLLQSGRELKIVKKGAKVSPVFNGNMFLNEELVQEFPECMYIDQDEWLQLTYDNDVYAGKSERKCIADMICARGKYGTQLFLENRIKIFYDVPEWRDFLVGSGYNFSIGSRIHGNIMAILSGIPAMVCAVDSRTREMAEFYNIPYFVPTNKRIDVQEMYEKIDYGKFNECFLQKFDDYDKFLQKCGLVKQINVDNPFWKKELPIPNTYILEKRDEVAQLIRKSGIFNQFYFGAIPYINRLLWRDRDRMEQPIQENYVNRDN